MDFWGTCRIHTKSWVFFCEKIISYDFCTSFELHKVKETFGGSRWNLMTLTHVSWYLAYVTCPHDWRIRVACGKLKTSWRKKQFHFEMVSVPKNLLCRRKMDAAVWHTPLYVTESVSYLWRGRREVWLCLETSIVLCLNYSPKPLKRWLTSTWNPDCLIVWNLWSTTYCSQTDCMFMWVMYTFCSLISADTNHMTVTLWEYRKISVVLPFVSIRCFMCARRHVELHVLL